MCKIHILDNPESTSLLFTKAKELQASKNSLFYCNSYFIMCIYKCYNIAKFILSNYFTSVNIRKLIVIYVKKYVHFSFMCDHKDYIINFIINFIVKLCIFNFCGAINKIMLGKETRISSNTCSLFKKAIEICKKKEKVERDCFPKTI